MKGIIKMIDNNLINHASLLRCPLYHPVFLPSWPWPLHQNKSNNDNKKAAAAVEVTWSFTPSQPLRLYHGETFCYHTVNVKKCVRIKIGIYTDFKKKIKGQVQG